MKKKLIISAMTIIVSILCSICLFACNTTQNDEHSHNWNTWTSDGANTHSHTCVCGESETKPHNLVDGYCSDCGFTNEKTDNHTHKWNNGVITKKATCKDTGIKTFTCSVCSETKTETIAKSTTHTYGSWNFDNANTHSRNCSICGENQTEEHKIANSTCSVCKYKVEPQIVEITALYLNKTSISIDIGNNEKLTATIIPTNATNQELSWISTTPTVATVENGTVTGISAGTTKIIVSSANGVSDVCTVNVSPNEFTVIFNSNGGTLIDGDLVQQVRKGESATAPNLQKFGYGLDWDKKFDNVTENITITAVWTAIFNFDNGTITGLTSYGLALSDIEVPSSIDDSPVRIIGDEAFINATKLKSIIIPDSVTTFGSGVYQVDWLNYDIGGKIFEGCYNLESLTLPFIGYRSGSEILCVLGYLFGYNEYQDSVRITQYSNAAQYGEGNLICYIPKSLKSVTVTGGKIQNYAFENCSNLTNVEIGNSVTAIGSNAFKNCRGLTSIFIPENVTNISSGAFGGCTGLTSINVSNENIVYHSINNCVIATNRKTLIAGCKNSKIPDDGTVTSIGSNAFSNCTGLTSITIPDSITSIGSNAFSDCTGLTSITIPDSITSIGSNAFSGCSNLNKVNINDISAWFKISFADSYANPLSYAKNLYLNNNLVTDLTIPDSITHIEAYAFYNCTSLTNITITDSVKSIATSAFKDCSNVENVIFENTSSWKAYGSNFTDNISSSSLSNPSIAATYLTSLYAACIWNRT